jgi:YihY family inner membrane protein
MNLQSNIESIDRYQQSRRIPAIIFGVIRKYGDDNAGYLGALLTYYGFLSLFPLLLAVTSMIKIALAYNIPFAGQVSTAVANLFPYFSTDLSHNVHGVGKTGIALVIGIILSLYGARGVADAFRHALNEIWQVPKDKRPMFPVDILRSFQIIGVGGGGFILSSIISSIVLSISHNVIFAILANLISAAIIYVTLLTVFLIATPKGVQRADMRRGALATTIAFQILQLVGGLLLARELHNLSAIYGTFALVLGLLFYISLQAQIMMYALEYNVVARRKLWPRSITLDPATQQDKEALTAQAQKEALVPTESIKVGFKK